MDSVAESLQLCQTKEIIQMSVCSSAVKASGCEIFKEVLLAGGETTGGVCLC